MGFWQNIKDVFVGKSYEDDYDQALPGGIIEASPPAMEDFTREGYRLVSQNRNSVALGRDLTPAKQQKMQRMGLKAFLSTSLGKRIVEIRKNLICSEGFNFKATGKLARKNKRLNDFFDKFWKDNKFHLKFNKYIEDMLIFGEILFYVPMINPLTGKLKLSWLAPELIAKIDPYEFDLTEPDTITLNAEISIKDNGTTKKTKELKYVREKDTGELEGNAFFFAPNKTVGATRGICDFIHVSDWLNVHSQIINTESDRVEASKAFVYRCRVEGGENAVESVIKRQAKPPSQGSVLVHSDREEWSVLQPQLTLFDTANYSTHLVMLILGGMGIPLMWYFDNSGSNSSSDTSMIQPIMMWAREVKKFVCDFIREMMAYAIQEARKGQGPLADFVEEDCLFEITSRDPDRGAYDDIGRMLQEVTKAVNEAVISGFITNEAAGEAFRGAMKTLNLGEIETPPVVMKNWNLEMAKAKSGEQNFENLQKAEGKANILARMFYTEIEQDMEGTPKPPEETTMLGKFLKKAIDEQAAKVAKEVSRVKQQNEMDKAKTEQQKQLKKDMANATGAINSPNAGGNGVANSAGPGNGKSPNPGGATKGNGTPNKLGSGAGQK